MTFNWRCAFGLHPWEKWSEVVSGTATVKATNIGGVMVQVESPYEITVHRQRRDCKKCGFHQMREVPNR